MQGWQLTLGAVIILLCASLLQGEQAAVDAQAQLAAGAEIYGQSCTICHYDGAGNPAAPDLKGSAVLNEGPEKLITLILEGQGGVSMINGKKFNGQMPKMDYLSDEEVAAVATYVLASFANEKTPVTAELVKSLRK